MSNDHFDVPLRLANVDMNLLPTLLILLQERSVTRAASRLGMSQPAVSHALRRLRGLFDDELLTRVGGVSQLTPKATELFSPLEETMGSLLTAVLRGADFDPDRDTRAFSLAMTPSTASVVAPVLLDIASGRENRVSFELAEAAEPGDDIFARVNLDLVLLGDMVSTSHPRELLYRDRWVAIVDPKHHPEIVELSAHDLAEIPHVAYQNAHIRSPAFIAMATAGIHPHLRLVSNNFALIPMLVSHTPLIAVIQERLARALAEPLGLRLLDLPIPVPALGMDLVRNPRRNQDPAADWLVAELQARFRFSS